MPASCWGSMLKRPSDSPVRVSFAHCCSTVPAIVRSNRTPPRRAPPVQADFKAGAVRPPPRSAHGRGSRRGSLDGWDGVEHPASRRRVVSDASPRQGSRSLAASRIGELAERHWRGPACDACARTSVWPHHLGELGPFQDQASAGVWAETCKDLDGEADPSVRMALQVKTL